MHHITSLRSTDMENDVRPLSSPRYRESRSIKRQLDHIGECRVQKYPSALELDIMIEEPDNFGEGKSNSGLFKYKAQLGFCKDAPIIAATQLQTQPEKLFGRRWCSSWIPTSRLCWFISKEASVQKFRWWRAEYDDASYAALRGKGKRWSSTNIV